MTADRCETFWGELRCQKDATHTGGHLYMADDVAARVMGPRHPTWEEVRGLQDELTSREIEAEFCEEHHGRLALQVNTQGAEIARLGNSAKRASFVASWLAARNVPIPKSNAGSVPPDQIEVYRQLNFAIRAAQEAYTAQGGK